MTPPQTAIVVGGGPAGLVAAANLAGAGVQTTLLEASAGLGGRAASEHSDGFFLNQGPHALYVGGPAMRELKALDISPPRWNPVSVWSVFLRGGKAVRPVRGWLAATRWLVPIARGRRDGLEQLTVSQWLDQTLPNPRARDLAAALVRVTTFVADHDTLSADVASRQIQIGLAPGVRYIKGGWQVMVDALAAAAEVRGATLRTRAGVRSVAQDGGQWTVTLDDETLSADVLVVATGGPDAARKLLGDQAPAAPGPAAEVSALDIGLQPGLLRKRRPFALGLDAPTYFSRHTPKGHDGTLVSLIGYGRNPRAELEEIADVMQPGWRDRAVLQRFLPKQQAITAIATPKTGGLAGRPKVDRGDGLYVAGDWLGPDGWLVDAALASGAAAARAAIASRVAAVA